MDKRSTIDKDMSLVDIETNLKVAERIYRVVQKWRIADDLHIQAKKRLRSLSPKQALFQTENVLSHLYTAEKNIADVMKKLVVQHPLWKNYFVYILGIGPIISAQLIGEIDINNTPHPSALWAYAGLNTQRICTSCGFYTQENITGICPQCKKGEMIGSAIKRERGRNTPVNKALKTITYKASLQFLMAKKSFYGSIYKNAKKKEEQHNIPFLLSLDMAGGYILAEKIGNFKKGTYIKKKSSSVYNPNILQIKKELKKINRDMILVIRSKNHIHFRALRIVRKLFLSHIFEMWRRVNGLEYIPPYAIKHMNHDFVISPDDAIKHDSGKK